MYSDTVIEHFKSPKNMGALEDSDAVGEVGNPVCGDIMHIYIKVKDEVITDIGFRTMGCVAAIATSSMITELAKGRTLDKAYSITRTDVADELGGLPPVKMHCSNLAADGLRAAIDNFRRKQRGETAIDEKFQRNLWEIEGINYETIKALWDAGYQSIVAIGQTPKDDLAKIEGVGEEMAKLIREHIEIKRKERKK
ncbi:iron-sulfur cluster assembly scaffold protein [Candidatus Pacearchaeota archaeon]|nr:iron-sulfur cluster assembly scaffold protein [Candidatus Pacearchaeota archaeon]